ncbi:hypothetical protein D917_04704 [Trichinella nativa]|uniref:Uncharacterized protein n=1 Tax=Trichinella nativa TaxID=6335 RepID=A0A1Y3E722_9BILA|nr:hypothetical protein D917_04704 [Trichinella nativa]
MTQHAKADNNDMNIRTVAAFVDHGYPAEENDHKWVIVLMPFTRSSCSRTVELFSQVRILRFLHLCNIGHLLVLILTDGAIKTDLCATIALMNYCN